MVTRLKNKPKRVRARATAKTDRHAQILSQEVRFAAILGYIRKHGSTNTGPMAEELGYHYETARRFANMLVDLNKLHRKLQPKGRGRAEHFFHLGPAPDVEFSAAAEADDDVDQYPLIRARLQSYPLNHRCDPLVCALFGVPAAMLEARP